eukprot:Protomagalhaensia_wolfi_Nauph_80__2727@NODE_2855_length_966_cov_141_961165_g2240_i0_p1_GENE_NODE_2855_length_966_cov_141_961165_g2240_i0NODE_2855_length_966_cov_141_961165_g2240_i0_p1_ORF_typecomplete_len231_score17_86RRM_1/PF00076_22/2_1e18RRM_1/PF00076_22/2e16Limkainb1/PF11608_8/0_00052Limkainb1/PF11608_8/79Limkainb1/PF11608_8/3_5RRM_5/PF13893_6/0_00011RRM_5/PF13893_6/0_62RRM_Rrp7/PF17799_1/1_2RRM_Rrp7/PF17799_1/0_0017RRM_3/PF08777_11/0_0009RRM_3/PF08777_11/65RRM_7/PF16367_5/0_59RRM_7/PF16367_
MASTPPIQGESSPITSKRVYVGNLAWRCKWQDLKDHMRKAGDVKYVEIIEAQNGRSKGCGIVEFVDLESAQRAHETLNDTLLFDRKIFIREDREARDNDEDYKPPRRRNEGGYPRYPNPARGSSANSPRSSPMPLTQSTNGRQLYVSNLPWRVTWKELKELFGGPDVVERADVVMGSDGRSRGFGIVLLKDIADVKDCIERMNGYDLQGRVLTVRLDSGPPAHRSERDQE